MIRPLRSLNLPLRTSPTKSCLYSIVLILTILCGCRTVSSAPTTSRGLQALQNSTDPTLSVDVLDMSIPIGDSFPVAIRIQNAPPLQNLNLQIIGTGITPSVYNATVATDASGSGEFRLSGRAVKPKLNALDVIGYLEDGSVLTGSAYVDFEPDSAGTLTAQAAQAVGEPTTIEEYLDSLPVVTDQSELEEIQADAPPAVVLDNVVYHTEDGTALEPLDAVVLNSPKQIVDTQPSAGQEPVLQAAACPLTETTEVRLKTSADNGNVLDIPVGLNVAIINDRGAATITRSLDGGIVRWPFNCSSFLRFEVQAQPANRVVDGGIKMTTGGGGIVIWAKTVDPATGNLTADNIRGTTISIAQGVSAFSQKSQRVFFKVHQAWNWERKIPKRGSVFNYVVEVYYPYGGSGGLSNIGVINYPDSFTFYDVGIFHEYGHQAYYLRMLGPSEFNNQRNRTPICQGSLTWVLWKSAEGCVGILEGWAVFFENVASDRFNTNPGRSVEINRYDPDPGDGYTNIGTPGNVAGFLWDITDDHGSNPDLNDFDNDIIVNTNQSIESRFEQTGNYFYNLPVITNFGVVWDRNIAPKLRGIPGRCDAYEDTAFKNRMLLKC